MHVCPSRTLSVCRHYQCNLATSCLCKSLALLVVWGFPRAINSYNRVLSLLTCYLTIVDSTSIKSNERNTTHDGRKYCAGARLLPNRWTPQPLTTIASANSCTNQNMKLPSEAGPRANWLLCIYITCMQTETLTFTGCRFLRGQLAVRNWNGVAGA